MPLIYILTNPWMKQDQVYKIGRSDVDHIDDLLSQYATRYIPLKQLIKSWIVGNSMVVEELIFHRIENNQLIEKVDGEWYKGPVSIMIDIIEELMKTISYQDEFVDEWPVFLCSNRRLTLLMKERCIKNPYAEHHHEWKYASILLLIHRDAIIRSYEYDKHLDEKILRTLIEEFKYVNEFISTSNIIAFLYIHVSINERKIRSAMMDLGFDYKDRKDAIRQLRFMHFRYTGYLTKVPMSLLREMTEDDIDIRGLKKDELLVYIRNPVLRDKILFHANIRSVIPSIRKQLKFE